MARGDDPMESQGRCRGPSTRTRAGSQFFICLNYEKTKRWIASTRVRRTSADGHAGEIGGGEVDIATGRAKQR
jgi:hypothetical protein